MSTPPIETATKTESRRTAQPEPSGSLRFASWNVHGCLGLDFKREPYRVAKVIEGLRANVVGLQEVDSRRGHDQFRLLAAEAGYEAHPAPTMGSGALRYGNMLLTRLPVRDVRVHDLSLPGREPRGAVEAILESDGKPVRVIVTHFGLSARERQLQAERLLSVIASDDLPSVLLGDLNAWRRSSGCLRTLRTRFGSTPAPATFPSPLPMIALDRAWASGCQLVGHGVHRSRAARISSDHLPVMAQVRLN